MGIEVRSASATFEDTWVEDYEVGDGFETIVGGVSASSHGGGSEFCDESGGDGTL